MDTLYRVLLPLLLIPYTGKKIWCRKVFNPGLLEKCVIYTYIKTLCCSASFTKCPVSGIKSVFSFITLAVVRIAAVQK